jgi:hypothetical protein
MNILALNSSPHKDTGGTGTILGRVLEGARSAGAQAETVFLHGLDIKPCLGCLNCWLRTPGRCAQRDAMDELLPRVAACDAIVYATPLYVDGMNGLMKLFLDRCIPLIEPWFEERDNHCRHPRRADFRPTRAALVSASGFTELDNFDPLVAHLKAACLNMGLEYSGAVLRPCASSLPEIARFGLPVDDVLAACSDAGIEFVRSGTISEATAARVSRDLVPRKLYIQAVNQSFRTALDRGTRPPSV